MTDLGTYLNMGGYAAFIWPAYGLTALVLVALLVASISGARKAEADLDLIQQTRRTRRPNGRQRIPETERP